MQEIDWAQCRSRVIEQARLREDAKQSSFCTRALGVLSQIGRWSTSTCYRYTVQGCKLHPLTKWTKNLYKTSTKKDPKWTKNLYKTATKPLHNLYITSTRPLQNLHKTSTKPVQNLYKKGPTLTKNFYKTSTKKAKMDEKPLQNLYITST